METRLHSGEVAAAQELPAWRRLPWREWLIVLAAVLLRLPLLELKPPHFDEGVNGWFVDRMTEQGFYHYDPTNFHGPLHFYVLFIAQTLLGRHVWALRLPVVVFSVAAVVLALGFARFLGKRTCIFAALALAVSPAMTFYGRYAIHETELLFFLMLSAWGMLGLAHGTQASSLCGDSPDGEPARAGSLRAAQAGMLVFRSQPLAGRKYLWAAALGLTGCVLTKETYAIHFIAFALAAAAVWLMERVLKMRGESLAPWRWTESDLLPMGGVCFGLIVFFYSGGFLDWSSLPGIVTTFRAWVATGVNPEGGHTKEWYYWLTLLVRYEWPALLGLAASGWFVWNERERGLRWLILGGWAALFAYSAVRYKTPWCIIAIAWPFLFVFGRLVEFALEKWGRWASAMMAVLALGHSGVRAGLLNFRDSTNEEEPYVYVQTLPALHKITDPLWRHVAANPANIHLRGFMLFPPGAAHPLPWVLGDFTRIELLDESRGRADVDADFLLIDDPFVSDLEDRLRDRYFRESIVLRGNSGESAEVYFRASTFGYLFPGREPEFAPRALPPVPEEKVESDESLEERVKQLDDYFKANPEKPQP